MTKEELIEQLADKEHASWGRWMEYLFATCENHNDGSVTIPTDIVLRWSRQAKTPYADLSEREKQSDRDEVAHILPIIEDFRDTVLGEMFEAWKRKNPILAQSFPNERQAVDPDTAITAFVGWMTSRDEVSGPFSSRHEAADAVELVKKFCEAQGWHASNERFHQQIKDLKKNYPS